MNENTKETEPTLVTLWRNLDRSEKAQLLFGTIVVKSKQYSWGSDQTSFNDLPEEWQLSIEDVAYGRSAPLVTNRTIEQLLALFKTE